MSGSPFGILEAYSASKQSDAIEDAADTQAAATKYGIDTMLKMWEQAQQDFAPYLSGGYQGITQLTQQMPQYMQTVIAPLYQESMGYNQTALPDPYGFQVNPVTGQVEQAQNAAFSPSGTAQQNTFSTQQAQSGQNAVASPTPSTQQYNVPGAPTQRGMMVGGQWYNEDQLTPELLGGEQYIDNPALAEGGSGGQWQDIYKQIQLDNGQNYSDRNTVTGRKWVPDSSLPQQILNPNFIQKNITERTDPNYQVNLPQTQNLFGYQPTQFQNAFSPRQNSVAAPTQAQLEQGGVLAPTVPEFQRSLSDFEFNEDDPYFKTRQAQKQEQVNAWLAKQGLGGSTPGQTYLQREMDAFMADEFDRQYGRARTERDYMTQTDVDRYNMLAQRGNTLYGRMQGQQDQLYNRAFGSSNQMNQNNLNLLAQRYNLGQNIYGLGYGQALDLTKIGTGAAGSAGAGSMQTGQAISNAANAGAANQAAAGMAQSQVWANYMNGLSNQGSQVGNQLMNYFGNQGGGGGYYGNSAQPGYGQYGYLAGSGVQNAPAWVGAGGTTAFGM